MRRDRATIKTKPRSVLATRTFCGALMLFSAALCTHAYTGSHVNGKAVSIRSHATKWFSSYTLCGSGDLRMDGDLIQYTIADARVTRKDTLHRSSLGLASYPAYNLSGTKVAFFRSHWAAAATGSSCVTVNGGKSYISVINSDGTGLTDLCEIPALTGKIHPLDWPVGDWIYFAKPHDAAHSFGNNMSMMIWRVNAVTRAAESVCNMTADGSGAEIQCSYIHRFSLNIFGDKMALMLYPKSGCDLDDNFSATNNIFPFPPASGNLNNPPNASLNGSSIGYRNGCNISISPSGNVIGSYYAGWHDALMLSNQNEAGLNFTINNMETWAGEEIGNGAEVIRWAANSDKWVLQGIGNMFSGHGDNNAMGCNQVAADWTDQVAINISKNPKANVCAAEYMDNACASKTPPSTLEQSLLVNSDPGDMWISDPTNNRNRNSYEDVQGVWHVVPGAPSLPENTVAVQQVGSCDRARNIAISGRALLVSTFAHSPVNLTITDIRGAVVTQRVARGGETISLAGTPAGTYFISVNGMAEPTKIVLR